MKRIIFLVLLLSFGAAQHVYCQGDTKQGKATSHPFYVFAGANSSSIVGDDASYQSGLIGFEGGVGGRVIAFSERFGLGAELMYGTRGSKYHDEFVGDGKVLTSYIMLPVFLKYHFTKSIFAELGVQPGALLSAKDKYGDQTDDFKDATNSFDLPALIGAGVKFTDHLGAGLRYSRGLTNIVKSSYGSSKDYNSVIALRLMYFFGGGTNAK